MFLLVSFHVLAQEGLVYSGKTAWDPAKGELSFTTSGQMPPSREGFFWQVPPSVSSILIASNVTVTGGFRVLQRMPSHPLTLRGMDRATSVIRGTDEAEWATLHNIPDSEKWKYSAISVLGNATVHIDNLTSQNPRTYHVSGYAPRSVIHVSGCNLLDTRPGDNNNSDGFIGAAGSSIRNSFISTSDDAIKIYHDITIDKVIIEQHRNGAPIQFGWGGETDNVQANIHDLTIRGVAPDGRYNMAPFTWESGTAGSRTVSIKGLTVDLQGSIYNKATKQWDPAHLFAIKPESCVLNAIITNAAIGTLGTGTFNTRGTILLNGRPIR